jgi:hypothetical protein
MDVALRPEATAKGAIHGGRRRVAAAAGHGWTTGEVNDR